MGRTDGRARAIRSRVWLSSIAVLVCTAPALIAQQTVKGDFPVPLEVSVRTDPVLLPFGETLALAYELLVANPSPRTFVIDRVDVLADGALLTTWEGEGLFSRVRRLPQVEGSGEETQFRLMPGERYLLYGWIDSLEVESTPGNIGHRVSVELEGDDGSTAWSLGSGTAAVQGTMVSVDAPVHGGSWFVGNGFSNDADHRRFLTVSGQVFIPQRFGGDFLKLGEGGNNATSERPLRNESFYAFGEPVYAVADGEIVRVRRDLADNEAGSPPGPMAWDDLPGNHAVLKLDENVFALYAHLQGPSVGVQMGQRVARGDLIGRIGNSGNTSAPHLHFHMMDGPDPNLAEGVPFAFNSFQVLVEDYTFSADQFPFPPGGRQLLMSVPRRNWVIEFPARR